MKARLILVTLLATACGVIAQDPAPAPTPANPPPATPKRLKLVYNAPDEVSTGKRKDGDGGSRGDKSVPDWLLTLTPKSGKGLTSLAQPSLFSYQSENANMIILVTVTEPGKPEPLFIIAANSSAGGIHRVDLAQYNVTLKTGVDYEWTVALRPDQKNRSTDLLAKGHIRRVEPNTALAEKVKAAAAGDLPYIYAEAGMWYDALAAISDQVAANPKNVDFSSLRAELLEREDLGIAVGGKAPPKSTSDNAPVESRGGKTVKLKYAPGDPKSKNVRVDGDKGSRAASTTDLADIAEEGRAKTKPKP